MFKLTEEQEVILKKVNNMKRGNIILINALAGCAKTSTLKIIAQNNLNSKFLYLAFNRKIVDEAKISFPDNTKATTLHALARTYNGRKTLKYMNMDLIKDILNIDIKSSKEYFKVFNALKVYQDFCKSNFSIDELYKFKKNIRKELKDSFKERFDNKNMNFIINQRIKAIDYIEKIHYSILNSDFSTFDTFLKEFVETSYEINFDYDYIVLDESQDISKLLSKFIISLIKAKRYKLIIVGDNNQKIYGFLGNMNLSLFIERNYHTLITNMKLTRSFRFARNSKIEKLSNKILKLRGEEIIGAREIVPTPSKQDRTAYLSRGTFPLLAMSIHQIVNKKDYYLYGGIDNFNIKEIKDIYNLYIHTIKLSKILGIYFYYMIKKNDLFMEADEIIKILSENREKIPFPKILTDSLKSFSSFVELEYFASRKAVFDLKDKINIVYFIYSKKSELEKIEYNLELHIVDKFFLLIENYSDENSKTVISTIHKSKGLEFESVIILKSLYMNISTLGKVNTVSSEIGNIIGLNRVYIKALIKEKNINRQIKNELIINREIGNITEEYNILYVAITRAIRDIEISNSNYLKTLEFLEFINQNLEEIIKISKGKNSPIFVRIKKEVDNKKSKIEKGIIYQDSFISISTLLAILKEIKWVPKKNKS